MKGVVIAIVVLVLIVALGFGGYSYYVASGKPKIISSNEQRVLTCGDSDGQDIFEKGYTTYTFTDPSDNEQDVGSFEDVCDYVHPKTKPGVGLVRDTYCEGPVLKTIKSTCGRGFVCRDGACTKGNAGMPICSDSDGGNTPNQRGRVVSASGTHTDDCWTATNVNNPSVGGLTDSCNGMNCFVYEGYCDGELLKNQQVRCSNGCNNGACI